MEIKKAKYFCENCGTEVGAKAKFCPHCGKFFAAVRCPKCAFTGTVNDFKSGCPVCHYAMTKEDIYGKEDNEGTLDGRKHKLSRKSKRSIKKAFDSYESKSQKNKTNQDSPTWVLISSVLVIAALLVMIFFKCNQN